MMADLQPHGALRNGDLAGAVSSSADCSFDKVISEQWLRVKNQEKGGASVMDTATRQKFQSLVSNARPRLRCALNRKSSASWRSLQTFSSDADTLIDTLSVTRPKCSNNIVPCQHLFVG